MAISKNSMMNFGRPYQFNMVNSEKDKFKELGLQPLYLTAYPNI